MARINFKKERASGDRFSWAMVINKVVDTTKKGVKAFDGYYLNEGEIELPVGTIVLHVLQMGSVRNQSQNAAVLRVEESGLVDITGVDDRDDYPNWRSQFLTICDLIQKGLNDPATENPLATYSDDMILAEVRRRGLSM